MSTVIVCTVRGNRLFKHFDSNFTFFSSARFNILCCWQW